jgi:CRP/FNR family transcriptional regulator, cyclic AMP receptor protein
MESLTTYATMSRCPSTSSFLARGVGGDVAPRNLIAGHSSLGSLPEEDQHSLARWSKIRTLRKKQTIFRCGDPAGAVILVLEGYVKLSTALADGREVVVEIVGSGGCFGEVAVLNRRPRETDATTLSHCRLLVIDGRQFAQVIERRAEGALAVTHMVSERLRRATEHFVDALVLPAPARLAKVLILLAQLRSSAWRRGDYIPLRLSQSELGSMTGLTRESVNKQLRAWRDAGWILLASGSVTHLDIAALSNVLDAQEQLSLAGTKSVVAGAKPSMPNIAA